MSALRLLAFSALDLAFQNFTRKHWLLISVMRIREVTRICSLLLHASLPVTTRRCTQNKLAEISSSLKQLILYIKQTMSQTLQTRDSQNKANPIKTSPNVSESRDIRAEHDHQSRPGKRWAKHDHQSRLWKSLIIRENHELVMKRWKPEHRQVPGIAWWWRSQPITWGFKQLTDNQNTWNKEVLWNSGTTIGYKYSHIWTKSQSFQDSRLGLLVSSQDDHTVRKNWLCPG